MAERGCIRQAGALLASRPIIITPIKQSIPDGFTVFSAAGMKQTAKLLAEAEYGLFSYYLMKGMEGPADGDKDKKITAGELHQYVLANVSRLQQNKTPELQGDAKRVLVEVVSLAHHTVQKPHRLRKTSPSPILSNRLHRSERPGQAFRQSGY